MNHLRSRKYRGEFVAALVKEKYGLAEPVVPTEVCQTLVRESAGVDCTPKPVAFVGQNKTILFPIN